MPRSTRWEQQYFFENCLGRYFGLDEDRLAELAALPALQEIPHRLAELPRVLVHRDFQSQNIIIRKSERLSDRLPGHAAAASPNTISLRCSTIPTSSSRRRSASNFSTTTARRVLPRGDPVAHHCAELLQLCAMQRLMQALGAYGFLGLVKGNKAFL